MRTRRLGRTGLDVPECTLGTARLAAAGDRAELRATVARALDHGIDAIEIDGGDHDTACLLGEIVSHGDTARRLHVFARVPSLVRFDLPSPHVPVQRAYPGRHIRAETEALLTRLSVERLALQQIHAWCPEWLHEGDWIETMGRLRDEGKIAGVGISLFDHDADAAMEAVASGAVDAVQVMHNVFDPGAATALLPLCGQHGVGVIARAPLYYGMIAETPALARDDWRVRYFYGEHARETAMRVAALAGEGDGNEPVSSLALRFSLSHPAVSTVTVGMHSRAQLDANLQAFALGPLEPDACAALARHKWLC